MGVVWKKLAGKVDVVLPSTYMQNNCNKTLHYITNLVFAYKIK